MTGQRKAPLRAISVDREDEYVVIWVAVGKNADVRPLRMSRSKALSVLRDLATVLATMEAS